METILLKMEGQMADQGWTWRGGILKEKNIQKKWENEIKEAK